MTLLPELIVSAIANCPEPPHVYIGYSGGVDSHVLLHLAASISTLKDKITAVYIHHGLQVDADSWAIHCEKTAHDLSVNFKLLHVDAFAKSGESPEEAARNARYTALKSLMIADDDVLMIAQHREDQLETVLLQLFRGSGLQGLAAMPERMTFGKGLLLRPFLSVAKKDIDAYALQHNLSWVEDPTNSTDAYDRNFLRNTIVPLLKQRWPMLDKTVARSAGHCADALPVVAKAGDDGLVAVLNRTDNSLHINQLLGFENLQQKLILRQWFKHLGLKMPSQDFVERIQSEILAAKADANPILTSQGHCFRRHREHLYCLRATGEARSFTDIAWPKDLLSIVIPGNRALSWQVSSLGILREVWNKATIEIRFRRGGEKIRLPHRHGHHSLKNLFQEAGIPPWERAEMPLIYLDQQLAAIGDLWVSAEFYAEQEGACVAFLLQDID